MLVWLILGSFTLNHVDLSPRVGLQGRLQSRNTKTTKHYTMILSGREIVARRLISNLQDVVHQQQPCGVDLTLRKVSKWISPATIDFDNSKRQAARLSHIPMDDTGRKIVLQQGTYLVDFNETIKVPKNCMASIYPRSSLWRSGVDVRAGLIDAGYEGALGALMEIKNPHGLVLHENAKIAQVVFEEMAGTVESYKGVYQSSTDSAGRDGTPGVENFDESRSSNKADGK